MHRRPAHVRLAELLLDKQLPCELKLSHLAARVREENGCGLFLHEADALHSYLEVGLLQIALVSAGLTMRCRDMMMLHPVNVLVLVRFIHLNCDNLIQAEQ